MTSYVPCIRSDLSAALWGKATDLLESSKSPLVISLIIDLYDRFLTAAEGMKQQHGLFPMLPSTVTSLLTVGKGDEAGKRAARTALRSALDHHYLEASAELEAAGWLATLGKTGSAPGPYVETLNGLRYAVKARRSLEQATSGKPASLSNLFRLVRDIRSATPGRRPTASDLSVDYMFISLSDMKRSLTGVSEDDPERIEGERTIISAAILAGTAAGLEFRPEQVTERSLLD